MPETPHVRLALPAEAPAIAEIQRAAWALDPLLRVGLDHIAIGEATQVWHQAITRPPLAHYRVLVALSGSRVCGFALVGPSDDADAQQRDALVHKFVIAPAERGLGHGSRLMQAAVDTMRIDGYTRATWWVSTTDDSLRAFLTGSGWAPDGAHRELGTEDGAHRLKQVRLHTDISAG